MRPRLARAARSAAFLAVFVTALCLVVGGAWYWPVISLAAAAGLTGLSAWLRNGASTGESAGRGEP